MVVVVGGLISFVPQALSGMGWLHAENKRAHAREANHFSAEKGI